VVLLATSVACQVLMFLHKTLQDRLSFIFIRPILFLSSLYFHPPYTILIVVVAPVGTSLVESVGSLVSCQLLGSLTPGFFLVAVVSHVFLCRKWLYRHLALHAPFH
jgi:hypothetical protein